MEFDEQPPPNNMRVTRLDEEAVLKTVAGETVGGSSPSARAIEWVESRFP